MPSVEELLSQTSEEVETYADTGIEYCTVDDDTRLVTVPDKYRKLGVESDEAAKRVWFRFPKLVGNNGIDLSAVSVRVNFRNANGDGDIYMVQDLTADGDNVIFSWELSRKVAAYKGSVSFVVCAVKSNTSGVVKNEWNTTLNRECEVLEGLEVSEQIAQENPGIIEYILANLGGSVSSEDIANAVADWMQANPIDVPKNLSDLQEDATHRTVTDDEKLKWDKAEENVQSDWSITDTTSDSYIKNKPKSLPNPQKLTFAGAVTAEYDGSGAVTVTIPEGSGGSGGTVRIEKGSTDTSMELEPNKLYVFPEMAELSITLAEPSDTSIVSEYHFVFQSGTTATTLSLPDTIKLPSDFTVDASKIYEISILEGCLCAQSWAVS